MVLSAGCLVSGVPPLVNLEVVVVGVRAGVVGLEVVAFELVLDRVADESRVTALSASQTFLEMKSLTCAPRGCGRGLAASFGLTLVKPSSSSTMKNAFSCWLWSAVRPSSIAAITLGAGNVHLLATCPGFRHRQQSLCSMGVRGF